jgi:hypothetical protein
MDFDRWYADRIILLNWPRAYAIEGPEKCPSCSCQSEYSFLLPGFDDIRPDGTYQTCGFWCARCGWSNAGARPISQMNILPTGGAGRDEPL